MGQMLVLGSYPIHYHMALDVADKNPIVKSNSIHDTFSRCVTIHGTSGVRVEDNVAADHYGHCYFLGTLTTVTVTCINKVDRSN